MLWRGALAGTEVRRTGEFRLECSSLARAAHSLSRHTAATRADYRQASNDSLQKTSQRLRSGRPRPLNPLIRQPSLGIRGNHSSSCSVFSLHRSCHKYIIRGLTVSSPKSLKTNKCQKENLVSPGEFYCSISFFSHVFFPPRLSLKVSHGRLGHAHSPVV